MSAPEDVWSNGTYVAVADSSNNRALVWLSYPTGNMQAADIVLGQPNANTCATGAQANQMMQTSSVAGDASTLFVADSGNNRVLAYLWAGIQTNMSAAYALGQRDLTSAGANQGTGTQQSDTVVPLGGGFLECGADGGRHVQQPRFGLSVAVSKRPGVGTSVGGQAPSPLEVGGVASKGACRRAVVHLVRVRKGHVRVFGCLPRAHRRRQRKHSDAVDGLENRHHRTFGFSGDIFHHVAHDGPVGLSLTVAAHDDDIDPMLLCRSQNRLRRIATDDLDMRLSHDGTFDVLKEIADGRCARVCFARTTELFSRNDRGIERASHMEHEQLCTAVFAQKSSVPQRRQRSSQTYPRESRCVSTYLQPPPDVVVFPIACPPCANIVSTSLSRTTKEMSQFATHGKRLEMLHRRL